VVPVANVGSGISAYTQPLAWLPDLIREIQATIAAVRAERLLTDGGEDDCPGRAITLSDSQIDALARGGRIDAILDADAPPTQATIARLASVADVAPEIWRLLAERCRAWRHQRTALSCVDHPSQTFLHVEQALPPLEASVAGLLLTFAINGVLTGVLHRAGIRPGPWLEIREVLSLLVADPIDRLLQVGKFSGSGPLHTLGVVENSTRIDTVSSIWGRDLIPARSLLDECLGRRLAESFDRQGVTVLEPHMRLADVVLDPAVAIEVQALDLPTRLSERLTRPLWVLLHGPSGTGKTMLAQAFAGEAGVPLLLLEVAKDRDQDGQAALLGSLLRRAAHERAILFIDEADDALREGSSASRALLASCDHFPACVILATNAPLSLDPAMDRRLQVKVHLDIPAPAQRAQILHGELRRQGIRVIGQQSDPQVARRMTGLANSYRLSGGYWRNIVQLAGMTAVPDTTADITTRTTTESRSITMDALASATRRTALARLAVAHPHISWVEKSPTAPPPLSSHRLAAIDGLARRLADHRDVASKPFGMILLIEGPEIILARTVADRLAAGLDLPLALVDGRGASTPSDKHPGRLFSEDPPQEAAILLLQRVEGAVLQHWIDDLTAAVEQGLIVLIHIHHTTIPVALGNLVAARLPWAGLDPASAALQWLQMQGTGPVPPGDAIGHLRAARASQIAAASADEISVLLP